MGMRYAGFMAAARDDRLTREEREEAEGTRNETYQRQLERDDAAHQRQIDLLDMRQKNALKLSGIAASRVQGKKDAALRKKVDAFIAVNSLEDTPKVRTEISNGLDLLGKDFITGYKTGRIRLTSPTTQPVENEAPELSMGTPVDASPVSAELDLSAPVPASEVPLNVPAQELKLPEDNQMSDLSLGGPEPLAIPVETPEEEADSSVELSMGTEVEEEQAPATENMLSYGNREFIDIADYAGKAAKYLEQDIRLLESKGYTPEELAPLRAELEFVEKTEKDPDPEFSAMLLDANSIDKLVALQNSLSSLPKDAIAETERSRRAKLIDEGMVKMNEQAVAKARLVGGSVMYAPYTPNGSLGVNVQQINVRGDKFYNLDGTEISKEDISKGVILSTEGYDSFARNHNTRAAAISEGIQQGAGALTSLASYRQKVIDNPSGLNPYITVGGKVLDNVKSMVSAGQSLLSGPNPQYTYTQFEAQVLRNLSTLSAKDRSIAQAQLRAAYAMAAVEGSSGQGLSDNELLLNLESLGAGLSNPKKVVGLINDSMQTVVQKTEIDRKLAMDSFIAPDALKGTLANSAIATPFREYINQPDFYTDRILTQINEGLEGKLDYNYSSVSKTPKVKPTKQQFFELVRRENPDIPGKPEQNITDEIILEWWNNSFGKGE